MTPKSDSLIYFAPGTQIFRSVRHLEISIGRKKHSTEKQIDSADFFSAAIFISFSAENYFGPIFFRPIRFRLKKNNKLAEKNNWPNIFSAEMLSGRTNFRSMCFFGHFVFGRKTVWPKQCSADFFSAEKLLGRKCFRPQMFSVNNCFRPIFCPVEKNCGRKFVRPICSRPKIIVGRKTIWAETKISRNQIWLKKNVWPKKCDRNKNSADLFFAVQKKFGRTNLFGRFLFRPICFLAGR